MDTSSNTSRKCGSASRAEPWLKLRFRALFDIRSPTVELRGKLSLAGEGLANATQELQELKRALNFWLPMVPKDAPLDENECLNRIERDARLLFKYDGESDEKCAMELGWVSLRVPQSGLPSDKA